MRRGGHGNAPVSGAGAETGEAEGSGRGGAEEQAERRGRRGASGGGEDRGRGGHGDSGRRRCGIETERRAAGERAEWSGSARQVSERSGAVHRARADVRVMTSGAGWSRAREGSHGPWMDGDEECGRRIDVEKELELRADLSYLPPPSSVRDGVRSRSEAAQILRGCLRGTTATAWV
jgi:hypothetical protein